MSSLFAFLAAGAAAIVAFGFYLRRKTQLGASSGEAEPGTMQSKFSIPKPPIAAPTRPLKNIPEPDLRFQPGGLRDLEGLLGAGGLPRLAAPEGATEVASTSSFDATIAEAADRWNVKPNILKAIVARESGFNQVAINPEKSFVLKGVLYSAGDAKGRTALRAFIAEGGDPLSLGINPSIGLAQVRLTTARSLSNNPSLKASALFVPATNLDLAARLLRQLFDAGITIDTIDAYNVGQDLSPRNLPYRDAVKQNADRFASDF